MEPALRQLCDENDIRKRVIAFSIAMDSRNITLFRSAFANTVQLEIPPRSGDAIRLQGQVDADDYAREVIELLSEFEATQHVSTNHLVTIDGDDASCTCYTHATHYLPTDSGGSWLISGSRYDLTARRFGDLGWRFTSFRSTPLFARGNLGLWDVAGQRVVARREAAVNNGIF